MLLALKVIVGNDKFVSDCDACNLPNIMLEDAAVSTFFLAGSGGGGGLLLASPFTELSIRTSSRTVGGGVWVESVRSPFRYRLPRIEGAVFPQGWLSSKE